VGECMACACREARGGGVGALRASLPLENARLGEEGDNGEPRALCTYADWMGDRCTSARL